VARQNDGHLAPFPVWDDVVTFDGRPWRGAVDVVLGGFPCQDISAAGRGAGIDGEKSGLWREMARIVGEVRPRFVFVENSPLLVHRGLAVVLGDLASLGYDAAWCVLGAHDVGAPHRRDRIWIVAADADCDSKHAVSVNAKMASTSKVSRVPDADSAQRQGDECAVGVGQKHADASGHGWWESEPSVGRVADVVACRVDRLRAIGNGQVPAVAALAWRTLIGEVTT
jgi:DNA (cytosine-5)-methyltransferase 1